MAQLPCSMFDVHYSTLYVTHADTRTHESCTWHRAVCVHCEVHREAYTVFQSTSPSDSSRGLPGGVLRQQLARQSVIDLLGLRGSLSDLRSEPAPDPHCMSRSRYRCISVAQPCPPTHAAVSRYSISLITTDGVLPQHNSQPTFARHLKWSKIVYGHAGQGRGLLAQYLRLQLVGSHLILPCPRTILDRFPSSDDPCILGAGYRPHVSHYFQGTAAQSSSVGCNMGAGHHSMLG